MQPKELPYDKDWPKWHSLTLPVCLPITNDWMVWKNDQEYILVSNQEYDRRYRENNQ